MDITVDDLMTLAQRAEQLASRRTTERHRRQPGNESAGTHRSSPDTAG